MSETSRPLLVAANLTKTYRLRRATGQAAGGPGPGAATQVHALDDVGIELRAGQTLGVVGESGSGKSTLAYCLTRLVEPDTGTVTLDGVDVRSASGARLRRLRRRMQLVYQDPYSSLTPGLTVGTAITEAARVHGITTRSGQGELARDWLYRVGLKPDDAGRYPRELSGGQRQRVAIARALALRPDVLIADEPVSALDVSVQAQILNLLSELREELDLGMILIAHQLAVVLHLATDIAVMYLGRIVERGPVAEVFGNPGHPYTVALLAAQPSLDRRRADRPAVLEGEPLPPLGSGPGCRFRHRCKLVQPVCAEQDPEPVEVAPGHVVHCHALG